MVRGIDGFRRRPDRPASPAPSPAYAIHPAPKPLSASGHSSGVYALSDAYAGLARHVPGPGQLDAHGVADVDALVAKVNALLADRGMPPLSRYEFPNGKAKFARVANLARTLRRSGA